MTISGIGSWPGEDMRVALASVAQTLGAVDERGAGLRGVPYLPELPQRGVGADMIGRSASLLAGLAIDVQPSGWRLVDHPGRDSGRAASWWRRDRDELAEAFDGYTGVMKVGFAGPWTLAAELRLPRGERVIADLGAARDVAQSLAEGIAVELGRLRSVLPRASWMVQLDEPSLPAVLAGRLPTSSGYRRHRPVGADEAAAPLQQLIAQVREAVAHLGNDSGGEEAARERVVVHCCAPEPPVGLLASAGADAVALDTGVLDALAWEAVAELVESGRGFWAGLPVQAAPVAEGHIPSGSALAAPIERAWGRLGLGAEAAERLTVTPACGLAGADSPVEAERIQRAVIAAATVLRDHVDARR